MFSAANGVLRILTARHVLMEGDRPATSIQVFFSFDPVTPVPAKALDPRSDQLDLGVIEVRPGLAIHLPRTVPRFLWLADGSLRQAQHVWTMDGEYTAVPNTITRLDSDGDPRRMRYTLNSVGDGFSGAPIFDDYGRLVGVHDAQAGGTAFGVAVKIGSAFAALDALGYNIEASLGGPTAEVGRAEQPSNSPSRAQPQPGAIAPGLSRTPEKPRLWRNLANNQLYTFQSVGERLYIRQGNNVVGDLATTVDKKGAKKFAGRGPLSNCPGGAGYLEITLIEEARVQGRAEQAVNANGKTTCGGVFGVLRSMKDLVFVPE